jgi:HD-like signal output (HDOD) protein
MSVWGLPFPLVHAVAYHHNPSETAETHFSTLTAVHAADVIASATDASPLNHDAELDRSYLERLGLSERESVWRGIYAEQAGAPGAPPTAEHSA